MYEYLARIDRVVDGDTVDVTIDLGFSVHMRQRIRLKGIDAPESRTSDPEEKYFGLMAKDFVERNLIKGGLYVLRTTLDQEGKYGRVLGVIEVTTGSGETINQMMIDRHLAVPYTGQSRELVEDAHRANWEILKRRASGDDSPVE